jgi:hypothetical protein
MTTLDHTSPRIVFKYVALTMRASSVAYRVLGRKTTATFDSASCEMVGRNNLFVSASTSTKPVSAFVFSGNGLFGQRYNSEIVEYLTGKIVDKTIGKRGILHVFNRLSSVGSLGRAFPAPRPFFVTKCPNYSTERA